MGRFILLFLIIWISTNCTKNNSSKGISDQGHFISENNDRINTFFVYDFVSEETIKSHSIQRKHQMGSSTSNYYFSYNATIPNQSLLVAESLSEANKIIDAYSYGIKFAFVKNENGEIHFVNCSDNPNDNLCKPD